MYMTWSICNEIPGVVTGCVQPRLRAIVSSTCSECRQHLCTCTVHSNAFSVPAHTEEVSISDASDTYVKVDIEEGTYVRG